MKKRVISGWVTVTGPPRSICARKSGHDAAATAQHVPEADGHEGGVRRRLRHHAYGLLAEPLRGAHDVRGVDGLIGGDEDHAFDVEGAAGPGHVVGAEDIVLHRFLHVRLHDRHVLVRGGMEDHLRAMRVEDLLDTDVVGDGTDNHVQVRTQLRVLGLQLVIDRVNRILAVAHQHQRRPGRRTRFAGRARSRSSRLRR